MKAADLPPYSSVAKLAAQSLGRTGDTNESQVCLCVCVRHVHGVSHIEFRGIHKSSWRLWLEEGMEEFRCGDNRRSGVKWPRGDPADPADSVDGTIRFPPAPDQGISVDEAGCSQHHSGSGYKSAITQHK